MADNLQFLYQYLCTFVLATFKTFTSKWVEIKKLANFELGLD